jgi:addiction module HigA family antidote
LALLFRLSLAGTPGFMADASLEQVRIANSANVTLDVNNASHYYSSMTIKSLKRPDTEALFKLQRVSRFLSIERPALRKFKQLDVARRIDDTRAPPGIVWKPSKAIGEVSGACGSTTSFGFVFVGTTDRRTWRLRTIPDGESPMRKKLKAVAPGEMLAEEFLKPLGMSNYRLAKEIGVPAQRIGDIIAGKRAITADTDLRLCRFFGLSDGWWLQRQAEYDTEVARRALQKALAKIKPWPQRPKHAAST